MDPGSYVTYILYVVYVEKRGISVKSSIVWDRFSSCLFTIDIKARFLLLQFFSPMRWVTKNTICLLLLRLLSNFWKPLWPHQSKGLSAACLNSIVNYFLAETYMVYPSFLNMSPENVSQLFVNIFILRTLAWLNDIIIHIIQWKLMTSDAPNWTYNYPKSQITFICLVNSINQFSSIENPQPSQYLQTFHQLLQSRKGKKTKGNQLCYGYFMRMRGFWGNQFLIHFSDIWWAETFIIAS